MKQQICWVISMSKIELNRHLIGTINIHDGVIDITDPGYDSDVWCRMSNVKVMPGVWNCYAYKGRHPRLGNRVWIVQIVIADGPYDEITEEKIQSRKSWRRIGEIGVDSGLAGFFNHKMNFSDKEWSDLCDMMFNTETQNGSAYIKQFLTGDGFWTESGIGDGCYTVHAIRVDRKIVALEIRF